MVAWSISQQGLPRPLTTDFHGLSPQLREEQKRAAFQAFEHAINTRVISMACNSAEAHETIAANAVL